MTAYTATPSKSAGDTFNAADWNTYIKENGDAVAIAKMGIAYKSATQSIATATATKVTWPASVYLHDVGLVSDTLAPTVAGWYLVTATVTWASNSTGYRQMLIRMNAGATNLVYDRRAAVNGVETTNHISRTVLLGATDTVEVVVQQNSGSSLNLSSGADNCVFELRLVSW